MTVNHGQVVIYEVYFDGHTHPYYGSINGAGEVSASSPPDGTISGAVRDNAFTGRRTKHFCYFSITMQKAPVPTTSAYDGKYTGISRTMNRLGEAKSTCAPNGPPAPLTIVNGIARTLWGRPAEAEGYVGPQGGFTMLAPNGSVFDGRINGNGTISGRFVTGGACSYQMVWHKE
jgi:hypothetical protein